jgi:hypothetical protein
MRKYRYQVFFFCVVGFTFLPAVLFCNGCGAIGLLGTPTRHEKKITAEYDLAKQRKEKILVLVNQPGWLKAQANLRYYLTDAIYKELANKIKVSPRHFVPYVRLSEFRSGRRDFSVLSPIETGKALGANTVLFVAIDSYEVSRIAETPYYKSFLSVRSSLYATATGERLWPESADGKSIKVGFEVESRGREAAVERLARGVAHCTIRYFYDCPEDKFKLGDERSGVGWESWKKERTLGDL